MNRITFYLLLILLVFTSTVLLEANQIRNGEFDNASDWNIVKIHGSTSADISFQADKPSGGEGNSLRLHSTGSGNILAYQKLSLNSGQQYKINGFFKDRGSKDAWAEVFVSRIRPLQGSDYSSGLLINSNAFEGGCAGWDSSFADACGQSETLFSFPKRDKLTVYVVLKAGSIEGGYFDILFDSISIEPASDQNKSNSSNEWKTWNATQGASLEINIQNPPITHIKSSANSFSNGGIYKKVQLKQGNKYHLTGHAKDNGSKDTWLQIYITKAPPAEGEDIKTDWIANLNTWGCAGWDCPIDQECGADKPKLPFVPTETGAHYLIIKAGCNDGGKVDVTLNQIRLKNISGE